MGGFLGLMNATVKITYHTIPPTSDYMDIGVPQQQQPSILSQYLEVQSLHLRLLQQNAAYAAKALSKIQNDT
jgi:hypothetical protein